MLLWLTALGTAGPSSWLLLQALASDPLFQLALCQAAAVPHQLHLPPLTFGLLHPWWLVLGLGLWFRPFSATKVQRKWKVSREE